MLNTLLQNLRLPAEAKRRRTADRAGLPASLPDITAAKLAMLDWLGNAQDLSRTADGGVARHYSVVSGWGASYPETTGYIVPTMLNAGESLGRPDLIARGFRMLDWLVSIQYPDGGIQGGMVDQLPKRPVTFNTGQVLIGLAAGAQRRPDRYGEAMTRAACWLRDSLDADGCWRKHPTPFAAAGEKAYETHVSWGLFEATRVGGDASFAEAGLRNCRWAISKQRPSGWFASNCLTDPSQPLTHTIGYVIRGILEGHAQTGEADLLDAATRACRPLARQVDARGFLSGRLREDWSGAVPWVCLTGNAQLALCFSRVARLTDDADLEEAAGRLLGYVLRSVSITGAPGERGGVRGSFPIDGDYGKWEYLNWAAKFTIDALLDGTVPR